LPPTRSIGSSDCAAANQKPGCPGLRKQSPQTNGIVERFQTALNEFYRVAFRKKLYRSIDELQIDLDTWMAEFNRQRPHQGRWCFGKTPMQTFLDAKPIALEKMIAVADHIGHPTSSSDTDCQTKF
jgi:hypothetical protein